MQYESPNPVKDASKFDDTFEWTLQQAREHFEEAEEDD